MTIKRRGNRLYLEVNGDECHYWLQEYLLLGAIFQKLTNTERIVGWLSMRLSIEIMIEDRPRKENGVPLV